MMKLEQMQEKLLKKKEANVEKAKKEESKPQQEIKPKEDKK